MATYTTTTGVNYVWNNAHVTSGTADYYLPVSYTITTSGSTTGWVYTGGYYRNYVTRYLRDHERQREVARAAEATRQLTADEEQQRRQRENALRHRRELEAQRRNEYEEQAQRRQAAAERASELLKEMVARHHEEGDIFQERNKIEFTGSDGHRYRIDLTGGVHGNVWRIDEHGCELANMCFAPNLRLGTGDPLPYEDAYLGQYLALKRDAASVKNVANFSQYRECRRGNDTVQPTRHVGDFAIAG